MQRNLESDESAGDLVDRATLGRALEAAPLAKVIVGRARYH